MSKNKLGVVFKARYLKSALEAPPPAENYVSVGLILKEVVEEKLSVETLYFNKKDSAFSIRHPERMRARIYVSNKAKLKKLDEANFENVSEEDQKKIKDESAFQFWNVMNEPANSHMKPLVYFSRDDLELLLASNVKTVTFSGAQVNYGIGLRDFEEEAVDEENKSTYPTLKGESNLRNDKEGDLIPNVSLALPCPPIWEDTDYIKKVITNKILNSVKSNYGIFAEPTRDFIPRGFDKDAMFKNWVSFLKDQK